MRKIAIQPVFRLLSFYYSGCGKLQKLPSLITVNLNFPTNMVTPWSKTFKRKNYIEPHGKVGFFATNMDTEKVYLIVSFQMKQVCSETINLISILGAG